MNQPLLLLFLIILAHNWIVSLEKKVTFCTSVVQTTGCFSHSFDCVLLLTASTLLTCWCSNLINWNCDHYYFATFLNLFTVIDILGPTKLRETNFSWILTCFWNSPSMARLSALLTTWALYYLAKFNNYHIIGQPAQYSTICVETWLPSISQFELAHHQIYQSIAFHTLINRFLVYYYYLILLSFYY